jgi:Mrp family chromosome partitioning ATPase
MTDRDLGMYSETTAASRVTLMGSIRQYWWIVLVITIAFILLGVFLASTQDEIYEATASVILEDPRAQEQFSVTDQGGPTNQASERYLADQVEILRSVVVATVATESLDWEPTPGEVIDATTVEGGLVSNLIKVTFEADTPEHAKQGADAVVGAYIEVKQKGISETAATAIESLDVLVASVDGRLASIQARIVAVNLGSEDRQELNRQLEAAQAELNAARLERDAAAPGTDQRALLNARIDELLRDFTVWDTILRIDQPDSELVLLVASRDATIAERERLIARQGSLAVDAEAATGAVVLVSPAEAPENPTGLPLQLILVGAAALGFALGAAIAYGRSLRKTQVADRREPEQLLDAPMLVEIPAFEQGKGESSLPMLDAPESAAAEAFRFIASAISGQQKRVSASGDEPARILAVASATSDDGRSIVTANAAIAFAQDGHRVLVIDADFETQRVTSLLAPGRRPAAGLAEIVEAGLAPSEAIVGVGDVGGRDIDISGRGKVDLLARGGDGVSAQFLFSQPQVGTAVATVSEKYDLVIIDSPPLLSVAYAGPVIDLADAVLAVVAHGQGIGTLREFGDQLDLAAVPVVGYVYDRSEERSGISLTTSRFGR